MQAPPNTRPRRASLLNAAIVAAAVLVWLAIPAFVSRSMADLLVFTALYAIAGLGVAFLLGQCGIVSLAQSAFYGVGAYSTAYFCSTMQWPALAAMLFGMTLSGAIAAAVGLPVLRLSGYFLALATLALGIIAHVLFLEWEWLTGGTLGIGGIPPLSLFGFALNTPYRVYYFVWPLLGALLWLHYNLLDSRTGLAMRSMRDAPLAASVLGIRTDILKLKMFVLSAVLGSLAGSLYAHYVTFVSVDSFGVDRAISFLLIAVLGGARTIAGAVVGALFVSTAPNLLSRFGDVHPVLFAALLIVAVIYLPAGFGGALDKLRLWVGRKLGGLPQ